MYIHKINIPLIVVIYVSLYISFTSAIELTVKIINFEYGNKLLVDQHHYASPGMVFGQCDNTERYVDRRFCTFVLQTEKTVDSEDHLRTCDIELTAYEGRKPIGKVYRVTGFGGTKAILTYAEQYDFCYKFAILDFSGCQIFYGGTGEMCTYKPDIISVRDDVLIDIVERDNNRTMCKDVKYCRMVLDAHGTVVTPLSEWRSVEGDVKSMMYSPDHGRLIIEKSQDNIKIRTVGADNEGRFPTSLIKEYDYDQDSSDKFAVSNTQQHLTVCHETNSWMKYSDISVCHCSQFNENGRVMFEMTQKFTVGIGSMSVHNLPYGGFLLLIKPCLLQSSSKCKDWHDNTFIATKIDRAGELAGSLGISQFRLDEGLKLHQLNFFINEVGEYCLSAVQKQENNDLQAKMTVVCFNEDEMEVSDRWTSL